MPGAFLKPQGPEEQSSDSEYLGFVSSTEVDPVLEYIAVEDYFSSDLRQISFSEGTRLILLEKSDDGESFTLLHLCGCDRERGFV